MAGMKDGRRSRAKAALQPFLLGLGAWMLPVIGVALIAFCMGCPNGDACTFGSVAEVIVVAIVVILLLELGAGVVSGRIAVAHATLRASGVAGIVGALCSAIPLLMMEGGLSSGVGYSLVVALAFWGGYWIDLHGLRLPGAPPGDDLRRFY